MRDLVPMCSLSNVRAVRRLQIGCIAQNGRMALERLEVPDPRHPNTTVSRESAAKSVAYHLPTVATMVWGSYQRRRYLSQVMTEHGSLSGMPRAPSPNDLGGSSETVPDTPVGYMGIGSPHFRMSLASTVAEQSPATCEGFGVTWRPQGDPNDIYSW